MKRTLLLASIAFIPTLALAQTPASPDRPTILAQRANDDDTAKQKQRQEQRKQKQDTRQERRQDNRKQAAEPQQKQQPQNAQQQKREDRKDAQQERRDDKRDARQDKQDKTQQRQEKRQDTTQQRQENRQDRRENRQETTQERRENRQESTQDRQENRQDRRENRQDATQDRRENRQDAAQDRREDRRLDALRAERKESREDGRTVIRERDRTIIRDGNRTIIRHDDTERFRRAGVNVQVVRRGDRSEHVIVRPGGVRVVTVYDKNGRLIRRTRIVNGREYVLFTNRPSVGFGFIVNLPPPVIRIPRERYIVEFRGAPPPVIYETLVAQPVMPIERAFTLDEVRYNEVVRARMPRIDIDNITFDTGSWDIRPDQAAKLEPIAAAMRRAIEANPNETYMIEGHTDAVGTDDDNLLLSDRRAQAVAEVLTQDFQVPPENMVPQGYGEQNLKVPTDGPEERNRYVSVRRITPLLAQQEASGQAPRQ